MSKVIVTLRSAPSESVEIPKYKKKEKGAKGERVEITRSCFGALRFFPGIPKAVTKDELEYIKKNDAELRRRLKTRPYVESKRVDKRGASESEVEALAESEGIGHLPMKRQIEILKKRGKIKPKPAAKPASASTPPRTSTRRRNGGGK